MLKSSE